MKLHLLTIVPTFNAVHSDTRERTRPSVCVMLVIDRCLSRLGGRTVAEIARVTWSAGWAEPTCHANTNELSKTVASCETETGDRQGKRLAIDAVAGKIACYSRAVQHSDAACNEPVHYTVWRSLNTTWFEPTHYTVWRSLNTTWFEPTHYTVWRSLKTTWFEPTHYTVWRSLNTTWLLVILTASIITLKYSCHGTTVHILCK